jgi:hypothetical protein
VGGGVDCVCYVRCAAERCRGLGTRDKVSISPATTLASSQLLPSKPCVLRWHGDELVLVHDVACDWCVPASGPCPIHVNVGLHRHNTTSPYSSNIHRQSATITPRN